MEKQDILCIITCDIHLRWESKLTLAKAKFQFWFSVYVCITDALTTNTLFLGFSRHDLLVVLFFALLAGARILFSIFLASVGFDSNLCILDQMVSSHIVQPIRSVTDRHFGCAT